MNKNKIFNLGLAFISIILISSCDLDLQEDFEFDDDAVVHEPQNPFTDTNMWDFMNANVEFDSLVKVATQVGMESLFSGGDENRTVLMLRNDAIEDFIGDQGGAQISDIPDATWEKLLNYHVITEAFVQEDIFSQENTRFQTLIDGDDGQIWVWKWRRYWELRFNDNPPGGRPSGAVRGDAFLHNYIFANGVAHQMNEYTGWTAY